MNKASELFKKIIVDGTEISLQQLDENGGKYNIGEQKSNVKVDFIFKNKEEIPEKLFTNTNIKKITIPESFKTIGNEAFAYTSLSYINLPSYISIGKDVFKNVENLPEEVIENITYNNPYALYDSITDINALDLENSISKNILIDSSEVANLYGTNKPYFKNVVIKDAEINSTISVKALENITFDGITGSGDKGATNGKITFTSYSLNIKNVTVGEETTIYNLFEGSQVLNDSNYHGIFNVNVENVNIDCPALTHNIINVYTPANSANIVIKDSTFNLNVNNSNVLRMANYMNSENVTITFDNVEWNYEAAANENSDWKWAGLMIFQPASQDISLTGDYSKLATWTINFNNCKYNGQDITGMNVGEHNQLLYFYNLNGNKKCVNPLQLIEGITININGEKQELETYTAEEAAAYNTTLDGALQYGAIKTPAQEAVTEHWIMNGQTYNEDPTYEELTTFETISDEASWNESYANGVLKKYYAKNPSEDLWNINENRACNFNDKIYTVEQYNNAACEGEYEVKQYKAQWYSDNGVQKIIDVNDNSIEYYIPTFFDTPSDIFELFGGAEGGYVATPENLINSCDKWIKVKDVSFGGEGVGPAYAGWVANGAQIPWICINFDNDANVKPIFKYEGKEDVMPWNDIVFGIGEGHKEWGIASLPQEFGEGSYDVANLQIILEHQDVEHVEASEATEAILYTNEEVDAYNAQLTGAVKAGDIKK